MKPNIALILIKASFNIKVDNIINTIRQKRHFLIKGFGNQVRKILDCLVLLVLKEINDLYSTSAFNYADLLMLQLECGSELSQGVS